MWRLCRTSTDRRRGADARGSANLDVPQRTPRGSGEGVALRGLTPRHTPRRRSIADDAASEASDVFSDDDSSQYSAYTDRCTVSSAVRFVTRTRTRSTCLPLTSMHNDPSTTVCTAVRGDGKQQIGGQSLIARVD